MDLEFVGDVIIDRGVADQIRLYGDSLLTGSINSDHPRDFYIINMEGTITDSGVAQDDQYNFKANKRQALLLREGGVTHASIANNHIYDFGQEGFNNTIKALSENGIMPLGNTSVPEIVEKGGNRCAILSASLVTNNNELPISSSKQLIESVKAFHVSNPSIPLILYLHWGFEYQPTPERWQKELAKELIEMGANAIVGHHPHVVQTIEFIYGKPVFYSLGNFVADAYLPETDYAYTVTLSVNDSVQDIAINPVILNRYFPKAVLPEEQEAVLYKYLEFSDGVCAYLSGTSWKIKPIHEVNFKEESELWIFAQGGIITLIKHLKSGPYLMKSVIDGVVTNAISLHGELSELQMSDIDNNGTTDILIGISKEVHFDPVFKKRINIYSIKDKNLKPLWLGTKFIYDIKEFEVDESEGLNYLRTTEIDENGKSYQYIYEWDEFGFALTELNIDQ